MRDGKRVDHFPADISMLEGCTPVYEEFDGWTEDITGCRKFNDLPKNAQNYIKAIERITDCHVSMIGGGPDRAQNNLR